MGKTLASKIAGFFYLPALIFLVFTASSCTTDITLTLNSDDSVDISFEGGAGAAFTNMILSAAGTEGTGIDTEAVSYELTEAGFEDVRILSEGSNVNISMTDKKQSSYIFTSGIVETSDSKNPKALKAHITRKSLEDFYTSADEQTRMIMDLFLAPVFNNEYMSEVEYLEMLASFYGEAASKEVEESFVKITLIDKMGKKTEENIPFVHLLCGLF